MTRSPIIAQLSGADAASAAGLTVRSSSPVLALCRKLLERGHHPTTPLQAYRGEVLCLRIRSIGEAAGLEVSGGSAGFRPPTRPAPASLIASTARASPKHRRAAPRPHEPRPRHSLRRRARR
jgi:hypothetical protein